MSWFRRKVTPAQGVDTRDPGTPDYMPPEDSVPPWVTPDSVNGSYPDIWAQNHDAFVARAMRLPTPTLGAVPTDTNDFVWSDGFGKMFPHSARFNGAVLDPANDTLDSSYGGNVGLTSRTFRLGNRLATMYYPDNASQQDINNAYLSYFGG